MTTTITPQRTEHLHRLPVFSALLAGAALAVSVVAITTDDAAAPAQAPAVVQAPAVAASTQLRPLSRTERAEGSAVPAEPQCGRLPISHC